jgi:hypothetical protein
MTISEPNALPFVLCTNKVASYYPTHGMSAEYGALRSWGSRLWPQPVPEPLGHWVTTMVNCLLMKYWNICDFFARQRICRLTRILKPVSQMSPRAWRPIVALALDTGVAGLSVEDRTGQALYGGKVSRRLFAKEIRVRKLGAARDQHETFVFAGKVRL